MAGFWSSWLGHTHKNGSLALLSTRPPAPGSWARGGGTACAARNWPSACFDFAPAPGGLGRRTVSTGRSPGSRSGAGRGGLGVDTLRQTAPLTWQRGKGGALGAYPESSLDGVGAAVIR